ncbi:DUF167 domain-containing protein [Leptolyngbya sp. FACHB-261]|nr:DUF167 domain-containing protein [Leptolyngbya sp. FACHB-261]
MLAEFFNVSKSKISLLRGEKSRRKIVVIERDSTQLLQRLDLQTDPLK